MVKKDPDDCDALEGLDCAVLHFGPFAPRALITIFATTSPCAFKADNQTPDPMFRPNLLRKFAVFVAAGSLLVAISLAVYGASQTLGGSFHGKVINLLPSAPAGWARSEKIIAETPEIKQAVAELLNYKDAVLVDYTQGRRRVSVYIAYWEPGRMSQRLVAGHTPDVCWVANGWKKETAAHLRPPSQIAVERLMAQDRVFTFGEQTEYVWYWHIVGNQVRPPSDGHKPWHQWFSDLLSYGLNQRQEQFFVRISSNEPLDADLNQPLFAHITPNLPRVDLSAFLPAGVLHGAVPTANLERQ
ncbi:MAG: exosortase-associated EpsI family protein [Verrucomicrobia bacterium]|nr:exosortase-associated EpsI family protein [Verrucomicrobiota bacterium]